MADLPEREQVHTSFGMLYTLAKKMEAQQPLCTHKSGSGSSDSYETSTKDTLPPWGRLQCSRKKSDSYLVLNLLTLKHQSKFK